GVLPFLIAEGLSLIPLPQHAIGQLGTLDWNRQKIAQRAEENLRQLGRDPANFKKIVSISARTTPARYLLEHGTLSEFAHLFQKEWPDIEWNVRFFQFEKKEEFHFLLDKEGNLISRDHIIPQEAE